jgi:hypothetical protein
VSWQVESEQVSLCFICASQRGEPFSQVLIFLNYRIFLITAGRFFIEIARDEAHGLVKMCQFL